MKPDARPLPNALASLRRYARPRAPRERCELCGLDLADEHAHLVELASRRLCCACDACAVLFGSPGAARYRRVPRDCWRLTDFRMTDVQWEELNVPIGLAFFLPTAAGSVAALYPSPAGATEALPSQEAWQALAADNPVLRELTPDVEALLVNRLAAPPEYYRLGIDQCYKLVGLVRSHWRGLSGGDALWTEVLKFFAALRERARSVGGAAHA